MTRAMGCGFVAASEELAMREASRKVDSTSGRRIGDLRGRSPF
jgi:hypothetical protein